MEKVGKKCSFPGGSIIDCSEQQEGLDATRWSCTQERREWGNQGKAGHQKCHTKGSTVPCL